MQRRQPFTIHRHRKPPSQGKAGDSVTSEYFFSSLTFMSVCLSTGAVVASDTNLFDCLPDQGEIKNPGYATDIITKKSID